MVSDSDRHSAGTGVRATRQRGAIIALLDTVDEFRSAQELHDELRRRGENIGLTTVYRTLQTLAAADLVAWAQLIGFTDTPELARVEINALRYRVLHVAARVTRSARQLRPRIDATWRWAAAIATAWQRLRAAFP